MTNILDPSSWPAGPTRFCLYGGPGAGKSTATGMLYAALKAAGRKAEIVPERIKEFAYRGLLPSAADRVRFFAEGWAGELAYSQMGVDVVTDSPLWLDAYYCKLDGNEFVPELVAAARRMDTLFRTVHIFVARRHPYQAEGRYQTADEAAAIDGRMKDYLRWNGVPFVDGFAG